ncbi:YeeE/YedE thiosulfate transporter family protein [Halodesulfurarchaeum sp. HSR-GB]|uniref:YeeE/YedE family protein n=1 Tax=Halodesulfurarchaeum sp. HSR-GB TaxID=3074077 RepID=UPI0028665E8E|nr:YeeE/YedE thiosulfate transporter family protein [Halodesulfurarchaeum sp. HSR-GB]MDR5655805.1 YeeE/YedE thiosulfate transporter family protein [Halodesulfurarchaeum sp. HSR-GB]
MVLGPPLGLFPNGIIHYAVGGILVGLGVVVIYLGTGLTPGASTFLESALSYVSDREWFQRPSLTASRSWRLVFTLGIVSGAALYALLLGEGVWTTEVQLWRLAVGGFLVGVGTRVGKGCTSGHGICGIGSLSGTSMVNVLLFLSVAILTAGAVAALGVSP